MCNIIRFYRSKVKKYNTNDNSFVEEKEARVFFEAEFDKDHDGRLSDGEALKAFDYLSKMPNCWTRDYMFNALARFREESLKAQHAPSILDGVK